MLPKTHIIFGALFSALLYLSKINTNILFLLGIFLSSFLIDFDHYLYYVVKTKDFSVFRAIKKMRKISKNISKTKKDNSKKYSYGVYIFHGIEALLAVFIISKFYPLFFSVLIGMSFHLLLDYIEKLSHPMYPSKFSVILDFYMAKKLKNIGLK